MRRAVFLLPLLAGWAQAQELQWGMHAIGSSSAKDLALLTSDATGFGLGLHAFISDSDANALRFRIEGQTFPGKTVGTVSTRVNEGALTADWLHFFSGRTESGPYTVLSAGMSHWRTQTQSSSTTVASEHKSSALAAGGLGWQLGRTFGLEAHTWWAAHFRENQGKAQGYSAVLTIRF